ncbi:NAD-dependent epimerase/dehydratase family protein [Deinococcus sp. KSM4-11]|uniref:thioester reductase domain-containing protein n=1 Tax=Deinococcus sp. KSM4-11 TaxID=2568654 RepID=UPI0010A56170|nr:thioester reductase domain-containing protein [Deinococcus sp. KSM4-11]THF85587.1 NAD-dependent epimerase/dehydratase family protein [Deinococcus sp. KSM4-11]
MSRDYASLTPAQRALLHALLPGQHLTAPATWAEGDLRAQVQAALERQLPEYMVPRQYAVLNALPYTRNGKVDVGALPDPTQGVQRSPQLPRSDLERLVHTAFRTVLNRQEIGIHDDFFILGGDSLLATELAVALGKRLEFTLPIALAFSAPTVAGLASSIQALLLARPSPAAPTEDTGLAGDPLDLLGLDDPELELERPTRALQPDVTLDADIQPALHARATPPQQWREVLLTGATGYFGAHLLAELLARTDWTVHLLVRADTPEAGLARVRAAHDQFCAGRPQVWDAARLRVHTGDLTAAHFGLDDRTYGQLSGTLDAIFHAGASVNFAYAYATLKPTNVDALQELFRLAVRGKLKAVQFVSSIHLFSSSRLLGRPVLREQEDVAALPGVTGGYAQSRWVAEGITALARGRGIPVTVYRPSIIGGDTRNGVSNENDALCRLLKGCVQLGYVPRIRSALNVVTADYASAGLVQLALRPQADGRVYHLVNARPTEVQFLLDGLRRFGYRLEETDFGDWQQRIRRAGSDNVLYTLLPIIAHLGIAEATGLRPPHFDDAGARDVLTPQALVCPDLDDDLLRVYLTGMVQSGYLPQPGARA